MLSSPSAQKSGKLLLGVEVIFEGKTNIILECSGPLEILHSKTFPVTALYHYIIVLKNHQSPVVKPLEGLKSSDRFLIIFT